ncbi:MAG: hypothetical protein ACLGIO_01640 [Acidimicrobiia bacterium]
MGTARLRWTGLAAVATLWATLGGASVVARFDLLGHRPLSHLVASPAAAHLFAAGLAGAAVLFVAFHAWLRARYPGSRSFSAAMVGGMAAQLVAAVVPVEGAGPAAARVHVVAALALGGSLPVLMWRFAAAQPPGPLRRTAGRLAAAELAACVVGVGLSRRGVAPLAEVLPAAVFHAWVATLTLCPASGGGRGRGPGREESSVEVDGAELPELVQAVPGVDAADGARLGAHDQ